MGLFHLLVFVSFILAPWNFCLSLPYDKKTTPSITLFEGRNQTGKHLTLRSTYAPNLALKEFVNVTNSVCATGTWLLYEHILYNGKSHGGVEYISGVNYSINLRVVNGLVSSVRFVGSATDQTLPAATIFSHPDFQGDEEFFTESARRLSVLKNETGSLVLTGYLESPYGWRLFNAENFQGDSVCFRAKPEGDRPATLFVEDLKRVAPTGFGRVKSVEISKC
jgi:hypothetical protein